MAHIEDHEQPLTLEGLPDEVLVYVFGYLGTAHNIYLAGLTCRRLQRVAQEPLVWRGLYALHYPHAFKRYSLMKDEHNWKERYRALFSWSGWQNGKYTLCKLQLPRPRRQASIISVCFNKDKAVLAGEAMGVVLYTLSGELLDANTTLNQIAYTYCTRIDENQILVTSHQHGAVKVWDVKNSKLQIKSEMRVPILGSLRSLQFVNNKAMTGCNTGIIGVWDLAAGKLVSTMSDNILSVAFTLQFDEEKVVAGYEDSNIRIFDPRSRKCVHLLKGHTKLLRGVQYIEDLLISVSNDQRIIKWDLRNLKILHSQVPPSHTSFLCGLRFDEKKLVTIGADKNVCVFDVITDECVATYQEHSSCIYSLWMEEDRLLTGGFVGEAYVWNFAENSE
jgi:WD40 repeat protein